MTRDTLTLPTTRSWRDIPQPVVPRAMSKEGRWRLLRAALRTTTLVLIAGAIAWGGWLVVVSLCDDARLMPAAAKTTPMKQPELRTDGVLNVAWLEQTLALPKQASLMELDLQKLRTRILADDQVVSATLTREFPNKLIVQITERSPVARIMTEWLGQQKALLVARDGVVYSGTGYAPELLETLPWLDGVALTPEGGKFRRLAGMDVTSDLLAKARLEAEHLYATWHVVSLARLQSDRKIEVRTKDDTLVIFFSSNANDDLFRQLVRLNYVCDGLAKKSFAKATIDLTLGSDVPVSIVPLPSATPAPAPSRGAGASALAAAGLARPPVDRSYAATDDFRLDRSSRPHAEQTLFVLQPSQSKRTKREL